MRSEGAHQCEERPMRLPGSVFKPSRRPERAPQCDGRRQTASIASASANIRRIPCRIPSARVAALAIALDIGTASTARSDVYKKLEELKLVQEVSILLQDAVTDGCLARPNVLET